MKVLTLTDRLEIYEKDFNPEDYIKHLNELAIEMLPTVASFLEMDSDELRARFINVVDFRMPPLNGSPETWDKWDTFQININLRFQLFLLQMIAILCSRLIIYDDNTYSVDLNKTNDDLNEIVLDKLDDYWEESYDTDDFFTLQNLSGRKKETTKKLMLIADMFTIAHNFGHVVLRKSTKSTVEMKFGRHYVDDIFKKAKGHIKPLGKLGRDMLGFWTNEITSDIFGYQIMSRFISDITGLRMFLAPGVSLLINCLEVVLTKEKADLFILNHVDPVYRLEVLLGFCKDDKFDQTLHLPEEFYRLIRRITEETKLKANF